MCHLKGCKQDLCPICGPVKAFIAKSRTAEAGPSSSPSPKGCFPQDSSPAKVRSRLSIPRRWYRGLGRAPLCCFHKGSRQGFFVISCVTGPDRRSFRSLAKTDIRIGSRSVGLCALSLYGVRVLKCRHDHIRALIISVTAPIVKDVHPIYHDGRAGCLRCLRWKPKILQRENPKHAAVEHVFQICLLRWVHNSYVYRTLNIDYI